MRELHDDREAGADALPDHAAVPVPPPLLYVAGFLAGLALDRVVAAPEPPKRLAAPLGFSGIALGAALIGSSVGLFRRLATSVLPVRPTTALATSGPYRFTRNPMYVGFALIHGGLALRLRATWSLLALPLVLAAVDRVVISREERYLERRFGADYAGYKTRVRRWL